MSEAAEIPGGDMVDVAFALEGGQLPADYALALWEAVLRELPWLEEEPRAGIHTLKAVETDYGVVLLPKRARLTLRVPTVRSEEAQALSGKELNIGGSPLRVGAAKVWLLAGASTLYADFVATGSDDEDQFCRDVAAELSRQGISARLICGRARTMMAAGRRISGFALALHSVPREHSRRLQEVGLGSERRLGCGILVQHKAINGLD